MDDNTLIVEEKQMLLSQLNEKEENIAREKTVKEALNKKIAVSVPLYLTPLRYPPTLPPYALYPLTHVTPMHTLTLTPPYPLPYVTPSVVPHTRCIPMYTLSLHILPYIPYPYISYPYIQYTPTWVTPIKATPKHLTPLPLYKSALSYTPYPLTPI